MVENPESIPHFFILHPPDVLMTHVSEPQIITMDKTNNDCCGARSGESVIKLPPKSGAILTAPDPVPNPF
jgi:hypothetical protein